MDTVGSPGAEAGQASAAPEGTTVAAPSREATGQANGPTSTTAPEAGQAAANDFFDPANLPQDPEIQKAYRQMQGAFTKRMQEASAMTKDAEQYRAAVQLLQSNPQDFINQIASQHGMKVLKAAHEAAEEGDWTPRTWEEVIAKAEERAEARVLQKFAPVLEEVHKSKAASFEKVLDDTDPLWRSHEAAFRDNLQKYPGLANDPKALFRLSMPEDYQMSRATQAALKKIQADTQAVKVGGNSTTRAAVPASKSINSFDDAVAEAKRMIAAGQGII